MLAHACKEPKMYSLLTVFQESNYEPGALIIDGLKWVEAFRGNTFSQTSWVMSELPCLGPGSSVLKAYLGAKGYFGARLVVICFSISS